MNRYNIVQTNQSGTNSVVLNHEPLPQSVAYDMMEVLRRSYQAAGYGIVHEPSGFIVTESSYFLFHIDSEKVTL